MARLRETVAAVLAVRPVSRVATLYRTGEILLVAAGLLAMVLGTMDGFEPGVKAVALDIVAFVLACLVVDWFVRLWAAPEDVPELSANRARLRWFRSSASFLGLVATLPMLCGAAIDWSPAGTPLLAVLWMGRFTRYSRGISMLFDVLIRELDAVLAVLLAFGTLLLASSVAAFVFEHEVQPDKFGSVPRALWWAIVTLTTTGYGDAVPVTLYGRMLAGTMMIAGIIVFGLLAGILATGFSQETRRQEFLRNWDLVRQVPLFRDIGPGTVADLAALLRPRELPARAVLWRRGDPGESMYFIVSGEVEVLIEPPRKLGHGQFFGELALLNDKPRNATVVTTDNCQLLELDIADFRALATKTPVLMQAIETEAGRRQSGDSADTR